jgi:hypothetical protein
MSKKNTEPREAKQGEKMIEIKLRFWTDGIAKRRGQVIAKNAWTSGMISMEKNKSHDTEPGKSRPLYKLLDIGSVVEKMLIENGVILHTSRKMKKYFAN